jgi:SPP1 gp7 family putative phage head morphogenesis protein
MSELEIKHTSKSNLISDFFKTGPEITRQESANHGDSLAKPYNTDDVYEKTNDYTLYELMGYDDQASVALKLKTDLVLGSGWEFVAEDSDQDEIKEDLDKAFGDDPTRPFDEMLEEVMTGYQFGFSASEKRFKKRDDGSLTFNELKTRHPDTWLIHSDKHGNVTEFEQQGVDEARLLIDPKIIFHYVNNEKFQNVYGTSDLRAAYSAWFAKRQIVRYYGIFLEKAASPKYDAAASPAGFADDLLTIIKNFQTKTALVMPDAVELEFLEAKTNGDVYVKAINMFNMFIARSILIPDLLGFSGSETSSGSFAQAQTNLNVFFKHIRRRQSILENMVNCELVQPIVKFNHGNVDSFPKFRFKPVDEAHAVELAKVWLEAVKGRVYKPNDEEINHFRNLTQFPEGDVLDQEQQPPTGTDPQIGGGPDVPSGGETQIEPTNDLDPVDESKMRVKQGNARVFDMPKGDFHKKVDFKAIETQLDRFKNSVNDAGLPIINSIWESVIDQIQKKGILKNQRADKIKEIKIPKLRELNLLLKRSFKELYRDSKQMAQRELLKGNFALPLADDKFLEVIDEETFEFVGDNFRFGIEKEVRQELQKAIRDGSPLSKVSGVLDDQGVELSKIQLERFARTKFTEVMNRGRLSFFDDSGVVAAYQYSAILDGRTTTVCEGLHGKVFKAGEQPVPPMHFNCRSTLIPITKFEDFKVDTRIKNSSVDDFIEKNKGEGFSKQ